MDQGGSEAVQTNNATASHRFVDGFDVAAHANVGSYVKALTLLKNKAVRILIYCANGSVEASVRSESSNDVYEVKVEPRPGGHLVARCNCFDFKRRAGLCKHGASVILALQHGSTGSVDEVGQAHLEELSRTKVSFQTTPVPKRRRAETQLNTSGEAELDDVPEPAKEAQRQAADAFAIAAEQRRKVAEDRAANASARDESRRRVTSSLKATLTAKLLKTKAASGDSAGFSSELQRRGASPLEEASSLLHAALQSQNEVGGRTIVAAILSRPEGSAIVNAAIDAGRVTPLHVAVQAGRAETCQLLLAHRADLNAQDSLGRTPIDIARKRRVDADDFRSENQILKLLRDASEAQHA